MHRRLSYVSMVCFLAVMSQPLAVLAGSAVSIPPEARDTAAGAAAAAQDILYKEQAARERDEAAMYARNAESELMEAELNVNAAENALAKSIIEEEAAAAEAWRAIAEAQTAADHAAVLNEAAKQAIAEAEAAVAAAEAIEAALQAEEDAIARRNVQTQPGLVDASVPGESVSSDGLADSDELLRMEKEIKRLEKMQKDGELARQRGIPTFEVVEEPTVDWSKAEAAYARAAYLEQVATDADKAAEQAQYAADQQTAYAEAAESEAAEAKQAVLDAQVWVKEAEAWAQQAGEYASQTKVQLEELIYLQEHPPGVHTFSSALNYYSGNSAYQFTQPISFGYWHRDYSYSINTRYILSKNNKNGERGQVSTFDDTVLYFTKRQEFAANHIVDYGLDITVPTGKAALSRSELRARMNEDLFEVNQFGKGWQFTPKIAVSRKIGKEDTWTIGTSCAFSGSYDPTSDIPDDDISPGNEWRKFLRWQHAGQEWQFVGELSNTSTGNTKIANGEEYSTGDKWEYRLTYNRKLPDKQNIMFYYWRENQNTNSVPPFNNSNALVHYLGTMWSKELNDKRSLRVSFDVMTTSGSRLDRIYTDVIDHPYYTSVDVDGRKKYTLGLGYDIRLDEKSSFSIDLQRFIMKDGEARYGESSVYKAPAKYHGFNVLMKYDKYL